MLSLDNASPGPAGVGAELRAVREQLSWTLPDMAAALRIRLSYLEALEAGRIGDLPAPVYTVGFVRAYAAALGLDAEEQVRRFKASDSGCPVPLNFPGPVAEPGLPAGAVALVAVVLAVFVYAGWYRLSGEGRLPAEVIEPVPERLAPLAEQAIPPTPRIQAPAAMADARDVELPSTDLPAVPPTSAAAMTVPPVTGAGAAAPVPPSVPEDGRIVLRARADSWLQVRERNGAVLLNRVLHSGESWPVPARPNLVFSTGNAGGTDLVIDGVVAPGVGAAGAVRRDLPLDADAIRDGKLPAQVQTAQAPRPQPQ